VSAGSLERENDRLRDQLDASRSELRRGRAAVAENRELRALLELPILEDVPRTHARVAARAPGNFEWTLTLDKGSERGIRDDMPVITPAGLVGKVIGAWRGGCKVRLLVDAESAVGVRVV
jgi:rod shape-determining protein MreC